MSETTRQGLAEVLAEVARQHPDVTDRSSQDGCGCGYPDPRTYGAHLALKQTAAALAHLRAVAAAEGVRERVARAMAARNTRAWADPEWDDLVPSTRADYTRDADAALDAFLDALHAPTAATGTTAALGADGDGNGAESGAEGHDWRPEPRTLGQRATRETCARCGVTREIEGEV